MAQLWNGLRSINDKQVKQEQWLNLLETLFNLVGFNHCVYF